jgi:uncharacterized membrane protein
VLTRTKTDVLKDRAESAADLTSALVKDKKFRRELMSAVSHGAIARRRAASRLGFMAAVGRISGDPMIKREIRRTARSLDNALSRIQRKRSHKLRNTMIVLVGAGGVIAIFAVPKTRRLVMGPSGRTISETIEVDVPVSTAYNQWTQFEDFPLFMEGVDDVKQLDDTLLHWAATVAGKTNEWDAKILEQHPDKRISWVSEDGKKTFGTVTFEPRGDDRAFIRLSMSYKADPLETVGSAAGLDARRIRGDLERFKDLIEARGTESGAWRGEVSAGNTTG